MARVKWPVLQQARLTLRRYCEWEDYPEKKEQAHKILVSKRFPPPPEFQLAPMPETNPMLEGTYQIDSSALSNGIRCPLETLA